MKLRKLQKKNNDVRDSNSYVDNRKQCSFCV